MARQREGNRALIDCLLELFGLAASTDWLGRASPKTRCFQRRRGPPTQKMLLYNANQNSTFFFLKEPKSGQRLHLPEKTKDYSFLLEANDLKYVLQNKFAVRQTGRVPGSWLCYQPRGTAKADTKDQSRDRDPKQHLCQDTYFFKRSVITHGNWKQPWMRYFTKVSLQLKSDGRGHQVSFSSSPCKHSNSYFCFMNKIIINYTKYSL